MLNPNDRELLEFIAQFCGYTQLQYNVNFNDAILGGELNGTYSLVPDYLYSMDTWLKDVKPKIQSRCVNQWLSKLIQIIGTENVTGSALFDMVNISARNRCLALYRVYGGNPNES